MSAVSSQSTTTGTDQIDQTENAVEDEAIRQGLNEPDSVLLVSTMKSGTHWMRYLFANYVKLLSSSNPEEVTPVVYDGLQGRFSPTDRRLAYRDPSTFVRGSVYPIHGISNIMWQHVDPNLSEYRGRIVYIYRNPLDYLVSRFHYDKKLWEGEGRDCTSVAATMPYSLRWYAQGLRYMRELAAQRPMVIITYETLKAATFETMSTVWDSLSVPVNQALLARSIEFSSAEQVRSEEKRRGQPIVGPTTKGSFVRDSSVGQWRQYFTDEDLVEADKILAEYNMHLGQFRLAID